MSSFFQISPFAPSFLRFGTDENDFRLVDTVAATNNCSWNQSLRATIYCSSRCAVDVGRKSTGSDHPSKSLES
ncbi:hypothetical protein Q1695_004272 [Nippostrongylus brasiliensis]|nr:hypothetical protein Q1695_004272 [Nippostrongylus brasiliensis]